MDIDAALIASSVRTEQRSNVFAVFRNETAEKEVVFRSDVPIPFGFCLNTNSSYSSYHVFMLRPEYGYELSAKSESGELVRKTRLGASYGGKFTEIKGFDRSKLDMSKTGRINPYSTYASRNFSITRSLPPPDALFELKKPGRYTVQVALQFYCWPRSAVSNDVWLVRLKPVNLNVIKHPEQVSVLTNYTKAK